MDKYRFYVGVNHFNQTKANQMTLAEHTKTAVWLHSPAVGLSNKMFLDFHVLSLQEGF